MNLAAIAMVWLGAALAMLGAWRVQLRSRNAGIVDVVWAAGMGASARR